MSKKYQGQFFTPPEICKMMAQMNLGDIKHIDESFN
jgi:type I restriction-modification system DNA methylase subunit